MLGVDTPCLGKLITVNVDIKGTHETESKSVIKAYGYQPTNLNGQSLSSCSVFTVIVHQLKMLLKDQLISTGTLKNSIKRLSFFRVSLNPLN